MKCQAIDGNEKPCTNEARYIDEHGQFMCGICPIKYGADSLRFEDVGRLIVWARNILDGGTMGGSTFRELSALIGAKRPEAPTPVDESCPLQWREVVTEW